MVELLKETEGKPNEYPPKPSMDGPPAVEMVRERIEAYIRTRYSERTVEWVIEGGEDEEWTPPLSPLISQSTEKWECGAWVVTTLPDGPLGLTLPSDGKFRITA